MIVDIIENYTRYSSTQAWNTAFTYLQSLNPETVDGVYEISGKDIYAIISGYETKARHKFEIHQKYIDIQYLLSGQEILEYTSENDLTLDTLYSSEKDIEFYQASNHPLTAVTLTPGLFVVLFPGEYHMPGVMVDLVPAKVKKVVIKLKASLLKIK